jgi:hypothetical protein
MSILNSFAIAGLLATLAVGPGLAQGNPPAPGADPKACSGDEHLRLIPGPAPDPRQTLSDKLARTEGVICPPNIDPDIKITPPDTGTMPVIPPPGSPGGDPTVRPK